MNILSVWSIVLLCTLCVSSQETVENPCTTATSCDECIQRNPLCTFCAEEDFQGQRCDFKDNLKNKCSLKLVEDPKSTHSIDKDLDYTSGNQNSNSVPVQVKPQEMTFRVRPNDKKKFDLNFQQQKNYPVDLYILFDVTTSFEDRQNASRHLLSLSEQLPEKLKDITTNFHLGFGSFVDKDVLPYQPWTKQLKINRCRLTDRECADPHVFTNISPLSPDSKAFYEAMDKSLKNISQSMDDTEGGLEALIQVISCEKNIGWRPNARRIVVYSSNSKFHVAGSGKLGGATKPAVMSCEMQEDDIVYDNIVNDYPSVSQIEDKLSEMKTNLIFVVTDGVDKDYNYLKTFLDQARVGRLERDSSNIVEKIQELYDKIRQEVVFKPELHDNVDFKFMSKCLGGELLETNKCENLKTGESVKFNVEMTVSPDICEAETGIVSKTMYINAQGLNEQLTINLQVICGCDCQKEEKKIQDYPHCTDGNGTLVCGQCECDENRYGRKCECDAEEISNEKANKQCTKGNDTVVCNGHGECICGQCKCFDYAKDQPWKGKFCDCNNYKCQRSGGQLCGGPSKGNCVCGTCSCLEGWEGDACDCTTDKTACKATNNEECNGHGKCVCGKCECRSDGEKQYSGSTCEDCLGEGCVKQCDIHRDCAQCVGFGTGKYSNIDVCREKCSNSTKKVPQPQSSNKWRQCNGKDDDDCTFYFSYTYDEKNNPKIEVQEVKECPQDAPVAAIAGGIVGAVVLIPLLLIVLFILLRNRRDAKEYAEFEKEKNRAKWDSAANPIYKDPKSTFQNPTYRGRKM